jgi:hypothetical protein
MTTSTSLRYINPPPSFVGGGERIRTARQVRAVAGDHRKNVIHCTQ